MQGGGFGVEGFAGAGGAGERGAETAEGGELVDEFVDGVPCPGVLPLINGCNQGQGRTILTFGRSISTGPSLLRT